MDFKEIRKLKEIVLKQVKPSREELEKEERLVARLKKRIKGIEGKHVDVIVAGSIARNTQLKDDKDIDVFVLFPESLPREEFVKEGIRIAKECFKGHKWEEAYAEHPYIRADVKGFDVEIVPSYKIKNTKHLKSSVDRTPFHNAYLLKKLKEKQKDDVRVLKKFLKGIDLYGADLKTRGFSGYLCELLILYYGNFESLLMKASEWPESIVIDIEKHYKKTAPLFKHFNSSFIVIDPTDKERNVAAALAEEQLERFELASGLFLKKPDIDFFNPGKPGAFSLNDLKTEFKKRNLSGILLARPQGFEDTVWGQLYRFSGKLEQKLKELDFDVIRKAEYMDEKDIILLIELKELSLPEIKKRTGPKAEDKANVNAFIEANKKLIVSGPRIEEGRIVIEVKRKTSSVGKALKALLEEIKKENLRLVNEGLKEKQEILAEKELLNAARRKPGFRLFLTKYFKGKEAFF